MNACQKSHFHLFSYVILIKHCQNTLRKIMDTRKKKENISIKYFALILSCQGSFQVYSYNHQVVSKQSVSLFWRYLAKRQGLPALKFRVLFLSALIQCLPQARLSALLFWCKFNVPTGSLLTSCAACLVYLSYFPRHQLLGLFVFFFHSSIGFVQ